MGRKTIKRGLGTQPTQGEDLHLAKEIDYIRSRAAGYDGRFVTIGPLILFSTDTGDAWLLDPDDQLAARVARDGDPEPLYFEESESKYAIAWKGKYRIEGGVFVYIDGDSARITSILGYPTRLISEGANRKTSKMSG